MFQSSRAQKRRTRSHIRTIFLKEQFQYRHDRLNSPCFTCLNSSFPLQPPIRNMANHHQSTAPPQITTLQKNIQTAITTLASTTIPNDVLRQIDITNNTPAPHLCYDLLVSPTSKTQHNSIHLRPPTKGTNHYQISLARSQDALSNLSLHLTLLQNA